MYEMHGLQSFEAIAIWAVLGVAILGLLYALLLRIQIMREDKGTEKMQEVWNAIKDGADAYLKGQLKTILPLVAILTIALFFSVYIVPPSPEALERFANFDDGNKVRFVIGLARAIAFIMGAGFSLTVGQIGMRMAVEANVRVASASRTIVWGCLTDRLPGRYDYRDAHRWAWIIGRYSNFYLHGNRCP